MTFKFIERNFLLRGWGIKAIVLRIVKLQTEIFHQLHINYQKPNKNKMELKSEDVKV